MVGAMMANRKCLLSSVLLFHVWICSMIEIELELESRAAVVKKVMWGSGEMASAVRINESIE